MGDGMSSRTPDGGYMPTFASNYMLDGFDFSEEYGEGPLMNHKVPTTSRTTGMPAAARSEAGMAKLPDGIVTADDRDRESAEQYPMGLNVFAGAEGTNLGDLSGMVREANHITDLSWLELAEQDPDRLPQQHNDKALQGLVEAWGTNKRTDGVEVIPNVVVPPSPRSQVALLPGDDAMRQMVASAMRKSAFGVPFGNILSDLAAHLGPNALSLVETDPRFQRFAAAVRSVKAEHGISGTLYLRDSAFPGLLSGKWDREIKKRCASARYWLTRPGSKLAAYQNYLGKQVVTEIPWDEALSHYRPTLEASGKRLASGNAKTVLVSALRAEATRVARETHHTYHLTPSETVTSREAWRVFASAAPPKREILQKDSVRVTLDQARQRFASWVRAGMLSEDMARKVLASDLSIEDKLRNGAAIVARATKSSKYDGQGVGAKSPERASKTALDADLDAQRLAADVEARRTRAVEAKVAARFASWVKAGMLTEGQAADLIGRDAPAIDRVRAGAALASKARIARYAGEGVGSSVHTGIRKASEGGDTRPVLKYAMQKMNEGAAGNDLNVLLNSHFSQGYLKGAGEQLVQLRRKHEGLAGHVYVAAEAYASKMGTTGCDQGSLIHRANQVKAVLQMERCGSCTHNTEGHCQKYAKQLVSAAPVANPAKYQRETIRLANADDSERTAAMFNNYDPGEFDLQNDSLDTFNYDNLPDHGTLHGILFEGMTLPEE